MNVTKNFGSDVFDRYTTLYSWLSNQVAHAMMGFAGTTLVAHAVVKLGWSHWWALVFLAIPILKDITDYFADYYSTGGVFPIRNYHIKELVLDGVTDFFFWSAGAALAVLFYFAFLSNAWTVYLVCGIVLLYIAAGYWFLCKPQINIKKQFDKTNLPYYYRLPRFGTVRNPGGGIERLDGEMIAPNGNTANIEDFMQGNGPLHLIIVGPPGAGKTTLACGIGSGLTVRDEAVRYYTSEKLRDNLLNLMATNATDLNGVKMVICDDMLIPFQEPDIKDAVKVNLGGKRVLWVLARNDQNLQAWIDWLNQIFETEENPPIVTLKKNPEATIPLPIPSAVNLLAVLCWGVILALGFFVIWVLLL